MTSRAKRVAVVAHCHLNVNAKVHGLATYQGVREQVIAPLIADGVGIVQLPCPETSFLGLKRWGMTVEQYDTVAYRRHCREILAPVVDTLVELAADDCEIVGVIGVDGSPSCGVYQTCSGYSGGEISEMDTLPTYKLVDGRGVFIEEFSALLERVGLNVPFSGVDE